VAKKQTLKRIGGSVGATLPKSMLEKFHLAAGDEVFLVETEEGVLITPYDPEFAEAMQVYARGARRYRNALHELAK
jgi:putative addiction module antidote